MQYLQNHKDNYGGSCKPKNSTSQGFPYCGSLPHQPKICSSPPPRKITPPPPPTKSLKSLLLRFLSPSKKIPPPVKFLIPPLGGRNLPPPSPTPYCYLENPVVGDSNKFLLKKSVTETHCNRILNH